VEEVEVAEKSEEEAEAETEATEEEPEVEVEETVEEEIAEKSESVEHGESKAEPIHDNIIAEKSKPVNVYEIMGRTINGSPK
jgi:hypothetical protein